MVTCGRFLWGLILLAGGGLGVAVYVEKILAAVRMLPTPHYLKHLNTSVVFESSASCSE